MPRTEHVREALSQPLDLEYLKQRIQQGWKLIAVEWERAAQSDLAEAGRAMAEVPFGFQVAGDCMHLEESPGEMECLKLLVALIVQDISLTPMAEELNKRGLHKRDGSPWDAVSVFKTFPRVIEAAPQILSGEDWAAKRKEFSRIAWES
jgi:hypothetical protein